MFNSKIANSLAFKMIMFNIFKHHIVFALSTANDDNFEIISNETTIQSFFRGNESMTKRFDYREVAELFSEVSKFSYKNLVDIYKIIRNTYWIEKTDNNISDENLQSIMNSISNVKSEIKKKEPEIDFGKDKKIRIITFFDLYPIEYKKKIDKTFYLQLVQFLKILINKKVSNK